jgi:hypothetical protein
MREPLEKRRELLLAKVMQPLPDSIRYSETLEASPAEPARTPSSGKMGKRHWLERP